MGENKNAIEFLGVETTALLKLQKALQTGPGKCGNTCGCAELLNERLLNLKKTLAAEIGHGDAAKFFASKKKMVEELYEQNPQVFTDISTQVHTKKLPEKIKNDTLTLGDMQIIFSIK